MKLSLTEKSFIIVLGLVAWLGMIRRGGGPAYLLGELAGSLITLLVLVLLVKLVWLVLQKLFRKKI